MSRSAWKNPYFDLTFNKKNNQNVIMSRRSKIAPSFKGLVFTIYNGKKHVDLIITENMIGHKFGEFSCTRTGFKFKATKKK